MIDIHEVLNPHTQASDVNAGGVHTHEYALALLALCIVQQ